MHEMMVTMKSTLSLKKTMLLAIIIMYPLWSLHTSGIICRPVLLLLLRMLRYCSLYFCLKFLFKFCNLFFLCSRFSRIVGCD